MTRLLVEVTPGRVKRWSLMSPSERRQADALARRKGKMLLRHGELLRELAPLLAGESESVDGPDGVETPVLVSVIETGKLPDLVLVPVLERELRALERWRDQIRSAEIKA